MLLPLEDNTLDWFVPRDCNRFIKEGLVGDHAPGFNAATARDDSNRPGIIYPCGEFGCSESTEYNGMNGSYPATC